MRGLARKFSSSAGLGFSDIKMQQQQSKLKIYYDS